MFSNRNGTDPAALRKIQADISKTMKEVAKIYAAEAQQVITESRNWPGFEGSRDIVDEGELRGSLVVDIQDDVASFEWGKDYSAPVHEGATIRYANGTVRKIAPRRWTLQAVDRMQPEVVISRLMKYYGST